MTKSAMVLLLLLPSTLFMPVQQPPRNPGQLKQIIPGHYVYPRLSAEGFSTAALSSPARACWFLMRWNRKQRAIRTRSDLQHHRPARSPSGLFHFHDNYSKGNLAYSDVFKIAHENYRVGFLEQLQRGGASVEEQRARLPNQTFRDRVTLYLGGKEIQVLYLGSGHTRETALSPCRKTGSPI